MGRVVSAGWPAWTAWTSPYPSAIALQNDGSGNGIATTNKVTAFQSTFKDTYAGILESGQFTEDTSIIDLQCNLFDGLRSLGGGNLTVLSSLSGNSGIVTISADATNVYDADTINYVAFGVAGGYRATASAVEDSIGAGCPSAPCWNPTDAFFGNDAATSEIDGVTVDGSAYGAFADQAACEEDEECYNRCVGVTKTSPLINVFVPSAVLGARINQFELGTHYHNAGAR